MLFILLTFFIIALIAMLAGLLLSPKSRATQPRHYVTRGGTRIYRSDNGQVIRRQMYGANVTATKTLRVRRSISTVNYERSGALDRWSYLTPLLNLKQLVEPRSDQPTPWLGLFLILVAIFGVGLFTMRPLMENAGVMQSVWSNFSIAGVQSTPASTSSKSTIDNVSQLLATSSGASAALVRVAQMDRDQYSSQDQYNTWAASACSAATMTEIVNDYTHHSYHISDILTVESGLHQITPELGLLEPTGIDVTLAKYNLNTIHLTNPSIDQIIAIANKGHPVIVSFPPAKWSGGHILIVRGGTSSTITLADSSQYNMTVVPQSTFLKYWGGFAVVPMPK
ncbi:MAG TPA: hypothetical protein VL461_06915 [Dictyobacter sp.]|jgi:hypothetical protein|nr:hypothetical protein [Dictyobacter sp.]